MKRAYWIAVGLVSGLSACLGGENADAEGEGGFAAGSVEGEWVLPASVWRERMAELEYPDTEGACSTAHGRLPGDEVDCTIVFQDSVGRASCLHTERAWFQSLCYSVDRIDTHRFSIDVTVRVSDEQIEVEGVRAHRRIERDFNRLCQEKFLWVIERTEAWSSKGRFESFAGDWNGLVTTVSSCEGGDDDFENRVDTDVFGAEVEGESAVVQTSDRDDGYNSTWTVRNTRLGIVYENGVPDDARVIEEVR